ncbi:uncharacterized protein TRUGW13939_09915 [Talaromyces rugulosus]|uniref:Uncharacterized protein n=1 Tax=Talaromyces rugulosus TaxID=121627 RepID=A0A7H8R8N8_TALRU|nr:uncharacterized protein TRUGW13939_09915 [Talaromyces rugulosus]QKX62752.1 hypothetical protein TRUGW13939_09915 [Talaromyces rugulosus]
MRSSNDMRKLGRSWKYQARKELQAAFPESRVSASNGHVTRASREEEEGLEEIRQLMSAFGAQHNPTPRLLTLNMPITDDTAQASEAPLEQILQFMDERSELVEMLMPDGEVDDLEVDDWEDLPEPLVDFVQRQDGLKRNREPITSREEFEVAYSLLTKGQDGPKILDITAYYIGAFCLRRVNRQV